jgi:DNA-binding MltR family transcriptional regulator
MEKKKLQELIDLVEVNGFFDDFKKESDRSLVLMSAAILEDVLEQRLRKIFNRGNSDVRRKLFEFNGPFSSFSAKIETLFCIGDLEARCRNDLHILRRLRNECAHNWGSFQLNSHIDIEFLCKMELNSVAKEIIQVIAKHDGQELRRIPRLTRLAFMIMIMVLTHTLNCTPQITIVQHDKKDQIIKPVESNSPAHS